jgi:hypothetical protein
MVKPWKNRSKSLRWLLISLMLAVQSLAHAHEVTHIGEAETSLCAVCSVSGGLAPALPAAEQCVSSIPGTHAQTPVTTAFYQRPALHSSQPRAPPVSP